MKHPCTAMLGAQTFTPWGKPPLMTRPRTVEPEAPAVLKWKPSENGGSDWPETTILRTALIAPVALVFVEEPACV